MAQEASHGATLAQARLACLRRTAELPHLCIVRTPVRRVCSAEANMSDETTIEKIRDERQDPPGRGQAAAAY
jgi:hypothetical protein